MSVLQAYISSCSYHRNILSIKFRFIHSLKFHVLNLRTIDTSRKSIYGNFSGTGHRIWVLGDSLVRRAGERAYATQRSKLGTTHHDQVKWLGRGGMKLHEVPRVLQEHLRSKPAPSMLIIHAGSNDLGWHSAKQCRQAVDDALASARELLPGIHISFSSILPRLFYYGHSRSMQSQAALNRVRKTVNKYARRKIRRMHRASFIAHVFNVKQHHFYHRDGVHLSDEGSDILIGDFESAISLVTSA